MKKMLSLAAVALAAFALAGCCCPAAEKDGCAGKQACVCKCCEGGKCCCKECKCCKDGKCCCKDGKCCPAKSGCLEKKGCPKQECPKQQGCPKQECPKK